MFPHDEIQYYDMLDITLKKVSALCNSLENLQNYHSRLDISGK